MIEIRAHEFYSLFALILDANNVMILAPSDETAVAPANYRSQEHIGNLCRAHAKVVACFMDNGTYSLDCSDSDCNEYVEGFLFTLSLLKATNHTAMGYEVKINVISDNSDQWIQSFFDALLLNDMNPTML